ncbi:MAG: DUF6033 family protein [Bacteroides sp.]|nr:DUF6033 family protein [Bacteroides sp.]MCM1549063.1 DUF6033 family protein [Clostridium sp.]
MNASMISQAGAQAVSEYAATEKTEKTKKANYGKTVGAPELSEKAQKYYEQLKKKYSNMDFILVSRDMKETAQANAGSYANANRMVVLIDEDKIERMATDEKYRKQYEGIISGATNQLAQLKNSLTASGNKVKSYGMQVKDGGLTSFFAVLDKSAKAQKERIAKKTAKKQEERKKAKKKEREEQLEAIRTGESSKTGRADAADDAEEVTITASSLDELLRKLEDYTFEEMSDNTETEAESKIGHHIDFRG